jgi:quinol monooxygenase YgiN
MSVVNLLGVTLMGGDYKDEFMGMVDESVKQNRENSACNYIEAFASPSDSNHFMIVSIWDSEEDLMEWYKSPFHMDLRKKGMQGMLKSYFSHLGGLMEGKSHEWARPEKAAT